jgi:hypothetical protein
LSGDVDIYAAWERHRGRQVVKSSHFPEAHQRHLARFVGTEVDLVEIGVDRGGSLQLWRSYLGRGARVFGVDIDPRCQAYEEEGITVHIGDQGDRSFLESLVAKLPTIDVLIDEAGTTCTSNGPPSRSCSPP